MEEIHRSLEVEDKLVDVELLELPLFIDSPAEITEEDGDGLKTFVKARLNAIPWKAHYLFTISRVPAQFREKHKALYEPTMVSIGPYYHGKESLRAMEEHKWRFLQAFLARKKVPMATYLKEMRALEPLARQCYGESINLGPNEFSLMLLLDGCFILEYFLRFDIFDVLPVAEFNWTFESLRFDLYLLENQIPFFVIHKLFDLWSGGGNRVGCQNLICPLCCFIFKKQALDGMLTFPQISCKQIKHLLHFYYTCIVSSQMINSNSNHEEQPVVISRKKRVVSWLKSRFSRQPTEANPRQAFLPGIRCATKLHEAGVTFRKKDNPSNMFDITFKNGVLEMPHMTLNPYIRITYTNLFAYEQIMSMTHGTFTSFTALMDLLVNTEKDVVLLERCGIIDNMFQNEEEAATFFNELSDFGILSADHHFSKLIKEVERYSQSAWPKYRARLMHEYFSSPWSSISVFAGVMLLSLTVVQTIFTVYSAFHH